MPRPPFPIMASPKTSLWQPTPYPPSQLFSSILLSNSVHTTYIPVLDMHISLPHHTWQFPYPQPGCPRATIPPLPNKKLHNSLGQSLTMSYSQPPPTYPVSTTLIPTTLVLHTLLLPSVPFGFSGTTQIIAPTRESSFSAGPMHNHVSPLTPLDLAFWFS